MDHKYHTIRADKYELAFCMIIDYDISQSLLTNLKYFEY